MLQIYNTLTRKKEKFAPLKEKEVHMYVCGITPYDTTHLGHAFTYITFDTLVRYLTYKGYTVTYTQNVTDINDRDNDLLKRAKEEGMSWKDLSKFWTNKFLEEMETLNWIKPTHYLFASTQLQPMIALIQKILAKGYAYSVNGGVYLDVSKYSDYGKLSKLTRAQMIERAKEFEEDLENPHKKHPLDITLWRPIEPNQPAHIPSFDSPFGKGRPGWHIECSAMSTSSLGEQIDIHGGGIDLIYPHHESEIVQSETATGKVPFASFWMHVAIVQKNHQKMSKSLNNLVMVSDLLQKYSANAIRWYLLSHHYQSAWNFEEEELALAYAHAEKLQALLAGPDGITEANPILLSSFEEAMDDNLNTPQVLDTVKALLLNQALTNDKKKALALIAHTLGFRF